ncbi:LuxR C-terminal-related transcriptional regulator [Lipingzhangella sp. LS1_29]|uniref:LuxR C-terminal-related transcriptional regulator n=1 Tax=Lipingzhangella rawalii TaxID=2055835 RepID=A0ABU2HAH4_9ACTN|nr:LuxR C-terminal-related transcriptional regulator [Lipingzhangella rawalii]MDS1272307.1 LuxR C-terminal-related transcriptional regulator [Lipingzhangella rawalii]
MAEPDPVAQELAAGDRALTRGAWEQARSHFEAVLEHTEHPAALEGLSWTHWWGGAIEDCAAARRRAYRAYQAAGDERGAARMAQWIGDDYLWYRAAPALAEGWFSRARRILDGLPECPEHGWQAVFDAQMALDSGDPDTARRLVEWAQRLGRAEGAVALEMFAVATEGMVYLDVGDPAAGLRCLDEATTAALAGEYEQLAPATWSCCLLLSACEELHDDERAAQWCGEILAFSRRVGARFVVGTCRSHSGAVLARQGHWPEAEQELTAALHELERGPEEWYRDALARLGDLRLRQGRTGQARELFERAGERWRAQAGLAALCLDAGDADGAVELAQRALRQQPPDTPRRAQALEVAVRGHLARGELTAAAEHATQLRTIAGVVATSSLLGTMHLCAARLAAADTGSDTGSEPGIHTSAPEAAAVSAARHFADAVAAFERAGAPLEAANARLELAATLAAAGQSELAAAERRRAHTALAELGHTPATVQPQESAGPPPQLEPCVLTSRQLEVLRLAAEGLTERGIAERLVVSEHTVHRHLANIYTRLGCSSRSAAIARAARAGLL